MVARFGGAVSGEGGRISPQGAGVALRGGSRAGDRGLSARRGALLPVGRALHALRARGLVGAFGGLVWTRPSVIAVGVGLVSGRGVLVAVGGVLIRFSGRLVSLGRRLVYVGRCLVRVRRGLIEIGKGLFTLGRGLRFCRRVVLRGRLKHGLATFGSMVAAGHLTDPSLAWTRRGHPLACSPQRAQPQPVLG